MTVFTIPGTPFAKERPRHSKEGRVYTPARTVAFEKTVSDVTREHFPEPLAGPVRVTILATFVPAKSWSKAKTAAHLHTPHTQRPDLDNLEKAILDGMNGIAFADDKQVAEVFKRKVWGVTPQTIVRVEAMAGWLLPPSEKARLG